MLFCTLHSPIRGISTRWGGMFSGFLSFHSVDSGLSIFHAAAVTQIIHQLSSSPISSLSGDNTLQCQWQTPLLTQRTSRWKQRNLSVLPHFSALYVPLPPHSVSPRWKPSELSLSTAPLYASLFTALMKNLFCLHRHVSAYFTMTAEWSPGRHKGHMLETTFTARAPLCQWHLI